MRKRHLLLGIAVVLCVSLSVLASLRLKHLTLPYTDHFAQHRGSEWSVMGGSWHIDGNAVVNRSDEHGAKLVTGSSEWKDIVLDADLKLIGHAGDIGLIIRVNEAEPGVDSYSGYYVGLRSADQALVMGRADHGWMEGTPTEMVDGVNAGRWYHLHLVAQGCFIGAQATDLVTRHDTWSLMEEKDCVRQGKIGLRSMATGGAWKHIMVRQAAPADLAKIRAHVTNVQVPKFHFREADLSYIDAVTRRESSELDPADVSANATQAPVTIEALKMQGSGAQDSTVIRGFVTLLSPLYVQDATGGIAVISPADNVLNMGDEIEIQGRAEDSGERTSFLANSIRLTGDRTLLPPVSVTSTQAAGLPFDGRLAELRARLLSKRIDANDRVTLLLSDSAQTFRAESPRGLSDEQFDKLVPGSELRIRGVCRVGPWQGKEGGAFTILMRSIEDAEVIAGPPWWSTRLLVRYSILLALLIGICIYIYLSVQHSKMRAILRERERLAHEMHDTLAQSFAGVGFHLQGVRNSARSGAMNMPAIVEKLTLACDLVTRTHREASAEIAALHPGTEDGADLLTLLERSAYAMMEGNQLPIRLVREGNTHNISLAVRDVLFHTGREAVANILRHANANEITMRVRYEHRSVTLEICDDGRGFNYSKHESGFGFRGMRRRAASIGAQFEAISKIGEGSCIRIRAPYSTRQTFWQRIRSRRFSVDRKAA